MYNRNHKKHIDRSKLRRTCGIWAAESLRICHGSGNSKSFELSCTCFHWKAEGGGVFLFNWMKLENGSFGIRGKKRLLQNEDNVVVPIMPCSCIMPLIQLHGARNMKTFQSNASIKWTFSKTFSLKPFRKWNKKGRRNLILNGTEPSQWCCHL